MFIDWADYWNCGLFQFVYDHKIALIIMTVIMFAIWIFHQFSKDEK